jgi:hypothetical protein
MVQAYKIVVQVSKVVVFPENLMENLRKEAFTIL